MPDSNSYEILLKFVMDNQGADKAIKTLTDFNKSFKDLNLGLEELDKKGLSTFDKLISTLSSSRTGSAIQQVNSLAASLKSLGFSVGQVSGGASVADQIQTVSKFGETFVKKDSGILIPSSISGESPGERRDREDRKQKEDDEKINQLSFFSGTKVGKIAKYGLMASAAVGAFDIISTGELAQSQAAQIQAYNLRIPQAAARGEVTLATLKALGIGLADQAEKDPTTVLRAYGTTGISNLIGSIGNALTGEFSKAAEKFASLFNPELLKSQYKQGKRDTDIQFFKPQLDMISQNAIPAYHSFLNTYRLYGQRKGTELLEPLLSSGRFTEEDLLSAQRVGTSAGIGMADIPAYAMGTQRRFLYSGAAEKAAIVYGYKDRSEGSSVQAFNTLLEKMGVKTATAETPVFSEVLAQSVLSGSYNRYATMEGQASPLVEASKIIYRGDLTPEDQIKNLTNLAKTFRGEEGKIDPSYLAFSRSMIRLGVTNPADISQLYRMRMSGQGPEMMQLISSITGKKVTGKELSEEINKNLKPFYEFRTSLYSEGMVSGLKRLGMEITPGGIINVTTGKSQSDIIEAQSRVGIPLVQEIDPSSEKGAIDAALNVLKPSDTRVFPETGQNFVDRTGQATAVKTGASISADDELEKMGAGLINTVAAGLEDLAKKIRNYPTDYRTVQQQKAVLQAKEKGYNESMENRSNFAKQPWEK